MTSHKHISIAAALFFLILFAFATTGLSLPDKAKSITWRAYDEGISQGKKEGKKVFLTFYANWCGYCKKMDQTTFSDQSVIDYLTNNYITVKINTEKEQKLAATYRVQGLPTHMFLDSSGEVISGLPGYVPPDQFLPILKYIQTESYKTVKFDEYMKNNPK